MPDLRVYPAKLQQQAAAEMRACLADLHKCQTPVIVTIFMPDYGTVRSQIRALKGAQ